MELPTTDCGCIASSGKKDAAPETPGERHQEYLLKKQVGDVLLEEATIDEHKKVHVKIRVDLLKLVGSDPESGDSRAVAEIRLGGIYIHTRSYRARRHHHASCE